MGWLADVKQIKVSQVAPALGLQIRRKGSTVGFTCPAHGEDHSDGRPSGRIVHDGRGWKCWGCGASGDAVSLAGLVLLGRKPSGADDWKLIREWYAEQGLVAAVEEEKPRPQPRLAPAEVEALWTEAWPAFTELRSRRWLQARGLHDWQLTRLCKALPERAQVPSWAVCERQPWNDGHNLLLPCFDAAGSLIGMRARWTGTDWDWLEMCWAEQPAPAGRKEVNPRGSGVLSGSVYASPAGSALLARGAQMKPGDSGWDGRVVIVEGGPCWLRYSGEAEALRLEERDAPIVLGVWSGAWPDGPAGDALASRMGSARVTVATDEDKAGEQYAEAIAATLRRAGVAGSRRRLDG